MKKFKKIVLFLSVLATLVSCGRQNRILQEAVDRRNAELDRIVSLGLELDLDFVYDNNNQDTRILKMALRRDSCFSSPDVEPALPMVAEVFKRFYKLKLEEYGKNAKADSGDISAFQIEGSKDLQAIYTITCVDEIIPLIYSIEELDEVRSSIVMSMDRVRSYEIFDGMGYRDLELCADRRIEILSGNLYRSNLFMEDW